MAKLFPPFFIVLTFICFISAIWVRPFGIQMIDSLFYFAGAVSFVCAACFSLGNKLKFKMKSLFADLDYTVGGVRYLGISSTVLSHRKIFYYKPVFFPHVLGNFKVELLCKNSTGNWFIFGLSVRSAKIVDARVNPITQDMASNFTSFKEVL